MGDVFRTEIEQEPIDIKKQDVEFYGRIYFNCITYCVEHTVRIGIWQHISKFNCGIVAHDPQISFEFPSAFFIDYRYGWWFQKLALRFWYGIKSIFSRTLYITSDVAIDAVTLDKVNSKVKEMIEEMKTRGVKALECL